MLVLNNLFGEITWFYCTDSSTVVNRCVTYNYMDSSPQRPVWTTGTLSRGHGKTHLYLVYHTQLIIMQVMMHRLMLLVILKEAQYTLNTKKELIRS